MAALRARYSVPVQYLQGPGPDDQQIAAALDAALSAPDHGRLQPWRFRLVRGAARERFAEMLVASALARDPATPAAALEKMRSRPLQAPLVIVASAEVIAHPKVPEGEQLLSAAAGLMNVLNAFYLQGFGAIWLTGPNTYDPAVARALGMDEDEQLLGFVYVGSIKPGAPMGASRSPPIALVSDWRG